MALRDLSGLKTGMLTVTNTYESRKLGVTVKKIKTFWKCNCECGNSVFMRMDWLTSGRAKNCGCINSKGVIGKYFHGHTKTRLYVTWNDMKQRCSSPNNRNYHKYGARGIRVCEEWLYNFEVFLEWASENGYEDNLTIERINNNGNYEPSNCRWITNKEQQQNKRTTVCATVRNTTKNIRFWSDLSGFPHASIGKAMKNGKETMEQYLIRRGVDLSGIE